MVRELWSTEEALSLDLSESMIQSICKSVMPDETLEMAVWFQLTCGMFFKLPMKSRNGPKLNAVVHNAHLVAAKRRPASLISEISKHRLDKSR